MSTTDNVTVTVIYSPFGANPTPQYFDSNPITLKPLGFLFEYSGAGT